LLKKVKGHEACLPFFSSADSSVTHPVERFIDTGEIRLRNKHNKFLDDIYPELLVINARIKQRCILDGELVFLTDDKPNFSSCSAGV
jgi:hypothetical protein